MYVYYKNSIVIFGMTDISDSVSIYVFDISILLLEISKQEITAGYSVQCRISHFLVIIFRTNPGSSRMECIRGGPNC